MMLGDIPDWIQEAERDLANGEVLDIPEEKEVTIKFGKGLVGKPFISKSGHEYVEVKIPNSDQEDHSPWASFVISPKMIHDNKFGKGVWMKLPEDGSTRVSKSVLVGTGPDGKNEWKRDIRTVSNTELKAMVESYKNKSKDSVLENMADKKQEAEQQAVKTKIDKNAGIEI